MRLLAGGMSDMNADIISFLIIGKLVKRSQEATGPAGPVRFAIQPR
jgi:hypothetical protein